MKAKLFPLILIIVSSYFFTYCEEPEEVAPGPVEVDLARKFLQVGRTIGLRGFQIINTETNDEEYLSFVHGYAGGFIHVESEDSIRVHHYIDGNSGFPGVNIDKKYGYKIDKGKVVFEEPILTENYAYELITDKFYPKEPLDYHIAVMGEGDTSLYRLDVNYSMQVFFKE